MSLRLECSKTTRQVASRRIRLEIATAEYLVAPSDLQPVRSSTLASLISIIEVHANPLL
jgi:hypothetical protein